MSTRFKFRGAGVAEILKSGDTRALLAPHAATIAARMRGSAPVDTGALQGSIEVWDDTTDRVVKRVGSRLPYAMAVEADTGFMSRSL